MSTEKLLLVLAIFGGIDLAFRGVQVLLFLFPRLLTLNAHFWGFVYDIVRIPYAGQMAVAARVDQVLNQSVNEVGKYLPKGWMRKVDIDWVRRDKPAQLQDDSIVLRVRPQANHDLNLLHALWVYFRYALFPETADVIAPELRAAIALGVSRAALEQTSPHLISLFDKVFLSRVCANDQVLLDHFADCARLNQIGFLMGPFVREVDATARTLRFSFERDRLSKAVAGIVTHMLGFQPLLLHNKKDLDWNYVSEGGSYGVMLVSKPADIRPDLSAYVRRTKQKIVQGVQRIYYISRLEEKEFLGEVVRASLALRELRAVDTFALSKDYRAKMGGAGAMLERDPIFDNLSPSSSRAYGIVDTPVRESTGANGHDSVNLNGERRNGYDDVSEKINQDLGEVVRNIIVQLSDYDDEWINLAGFGSELRNQVENFDPSAYQCWNMSAVLRHISFLEWKEEKSGKGKVVYIRIDREKKADSVGLAMPNRGMTKID